MTIFDSRNATVFSFPPFAGGKFLMNCLALSAKTCPQNIRAAEHLLKNPRDYDFRLELILSSLAPPDQMSKWRNFEFGDSYLYANADIQWRLGLPGHINSITKRLCQSNMKFFIVDHSMQPLKLVSLWRNAVIVRLINSLRFQTLSFSKKNNGAFFDIELHNGNYCQKKYESICGPDWPSWQDFDMHGYNITTMQQIKPSTSKEIEKFYPLHLIGNPVLLFDIDRSYLDANKFPDAVKNLYHDLDLDDFQIDLIMHFYTKYMELHLDKKEN